MYKSIVIMHRTLLYIDCIWLGYAFCLLTLDATKVKGLLLVSQCLRALLNWASYSLHWQRLGPSLKPIPIERSEG